MKSAEDRSIPSSESSWGTLRKRLFSASDAELLELYVTQRGENPNSTPFLPKLPSEEIQSRFTGLSNMDAFRQAFSFLRVLRDFAHEHGVSFGTDAQRVLDFGCGWGRITQCLLPFFPVESIHAVDVMDEALEICRGSGLVASLDRIHTWPPTRFPDSHFDFIVAYSVFSHLSEDNSFAWIRELARLLKPGGMAAITTRHRSFILDVQRIREQEVRPTFSAGAARSFIDTNAALAAYDRGEFCFDPEGKGGPGLTLTYGEALIPQRYAESMYSPYFQVVKFTLPNHAQRLDQATILFIR